MNYEFMFICFKCRVIETFVDEKYAKRMLNGEHKKHDPRVYAIEDFKHGFTVNGGKLIPNIG